MNVHRCRTFSSESVVSDSIRDSLASPSIMGEVCFYLFIYLFIMKFVQLGTQIKTQCEKKKIYKNTQKVHYEVHKNHIIKSTSDSQTKFDPVGYH